MPDIAFASLMGYQKATTWTLVTADVAPAQDRVGYMVDTQGVLKQVTLPPNAPAGFLTEIYAIGGQVRVVLNGNALTGMTLGDNLVLEAGSSVKIVARATGMVEIVGSMVSVPGTSAGLTSGTVFPSSPTDGQRFFRTDRGIDYFWNAALSLWLSVQEFQLDSSNQDNLTNVSSGAVVARFNFRNDHPLLLTRFTASTYTTGNSTATAYFIMTLATVAVGPGGASTDRAVVNTQNDGASNYRQHDQAMSVQLAAGSVGGATVMVSTPAGGGAGGLYASVSLVYRLIG